jgi:hypothetical protein
MADPRTYSLNLEDEMGRQQRHGEYVPIVERDYNYPQRRPLEVDRYGVAFKRPTTNLRPIWAADIHDALFNMFGRLGFEAKASYAFAHTENMQDYSIAAANGHRGGGVGVTGELITGEMDPELGGGTILPSLVHAQNVDRLAPIPKFRL